MITFFTIFAFTLPLAAQVWIPDFLGFKHTTGEVTTSTGHRITVHQRWNYIDFYTTEVIVHHPDGGESRHILDGDDNKHWSTPITIDKSNKTARVILDKHRNRSVSWSINAILNHNETQ